MSFGFSVGDFLAVIGLVIQLRKDFADAPAQLCDLSAELKTFSILLQDAEVDSAASEVDSRHFEALNSTFSSAQDFLNNLQKFIEKNKEIPKSTNSKGGVKFKRIWKRLNFDQQEVSKFRHQINVIISELQSFTLNELKHNTRKIARYVDKQELQDTLKWISDEDFSYHKDYQSHLIRNREAGTRRWLLGSDEWESWLKSGGQTLYCPGIPGSGKTFTTAMVIENIGELSEEKGWIFAYVFCNYQQRKENMCEILLRSLLKMVLEQTQEISDEVQRWPIRTKELSIKEIMEQLRISVNGCSRVFFMIDALDELDMFRYFVSYLSDLQKAVGINLYFTSRNIPHIRMLFDKAIIVPVKATEHDVGVYLDRQMRTPNVPNFVQSNRRLQDEIKETVVKSVGEMFLLAELQVIQLMQCKSTRRLQNALRAISSGTSTYESAYQNAMDRIQSQDKRVCELATNAISILAYAERPLSAQELVHALSVDLDYHESSGNELGKMVDLQLEMDSIGIYDPDLMPTIEDVLAASAGLITHQTDSGIVRLVHKTTKEYLMSEGGRQKWFPQAQFTIAAICLIYSQAFEGSGDDVAHWPFLDYAQKHYGHHIMAQQALENGEGTAIDRPVNEESALDQSPSGIRAQQLIGQIGLARMAQELSGTEDLLVVACEKNQLNFARVLLSTKQYSRSAGQSAGSETDSPYASVQATRAIDRALLAAAQNGSLELFDLLLKHGADPMIQDKIYENEGKSLLAVAASLGHHEVVSYILENEHFTMDTMQDEFQIENLFEDTFMGFRTKSPIYLAARYGKALCVKILFQRIEIATKASGQNTDLECILEKVTMCAMSRLQDQVLKILPRLSSTNIKNVLRVLGGTDLLLSSIELGYKVGHRPSTRRQDLANFFLHNYTFDLSIRDASGANALILAARRGMAKVVRTILEQREDLINSQDHSGRTSLSWATEEGHQTSWRLRLTHEGMYSWPVDPEGLIHSVSVLLGYEGIQAELADSKGLAPIDYALRSDSFMRTDETLLALMITSLEHGINRIDQDGYTLLHVLIELSHGRQVFSYAETYEHWQKLERYKGRKTAEGHEDWAEFDNIWLSSLHPYVLDRNYSHVYVSYIRKALQASSTSASEVRSSPCKCGVGTIFLAVATENLEVVEVLLDLYPDLVNNEFTVGSSPLDLASCILDQQTRQSMIDLILSKNPTIKTYRGDTPRSGIDESDPGEAQRDCIFTDIEIGQIQEDT